MRGIGLVVLGLAATLATASCKEPPTLSQIEQRIIARSCVSSSCHSSDSPAGGLDLKNAVHDHLVNARSFEVPTKMRVVPGDPDASFFFEKIISDTPTTGRRMPIASPPLPDEEIEMIREWIVSGAPNN